MTENTRDKQHTEHVKTVTTVLVTGATGRTGSRVADAARAAGLTVRAASRSGEVRFDWADPGTWDAALRGADGAYLVYPPDVGAPGAADAVGALARRAVALGVRRLVLLSARGEDQALPAEAALRASGADWTVLRCAWFDQTFSEGPLLEQVRGAELAFAAPDALHEPFIDVRDIADVAVTVLRDTTDRYAGQVVELTGPQALTWGEALAEVGRATGSPKRYVAVPVREYGAALREFGVPEEEVAFLVDLFGTLLDGRNESVTGAVERVLGRAPRPFSAFATQTATSGTWK
ncbi:NAD(P)H-binding protein [Streptomyces sp. SID8379]|uniref:NmrA family NAD(P)-binding protein n=1 Tax=unclassified Streptomyces TaxID=2593676 RepID=UPI0004771B4C|nr:MULTISPECIES: NAD(P)H-binding protein [unclassified Streptomyces]MYW64194.1 NAD(P)H-binding protein [Streptomyces sp. SID8379]